MQTVTITEQEAGQRLDHFLGKYLSRAGKGFVYKMMRKKNITLNGKKCGGDERLKPGEEMRILLSDGGEKDASCDCLRGCAHPSD